jgi:small subunit ribosomal protein S24e
MKIELLSEKESPLLNRKEIKFKLTFDSGVPTVQEIRRAIISKLKSDEKLTILNGICTKFGTHTAEGYVKVYKDEKSMKVEPEFRIKKNFEVKEKKEQVKEEGGGEEAPEEKGSRKEEEESKDEKSKTVEKGERSEGKKEGEDERVKEEEVKKEGKENG